MFDCTTSILAASLRQRAQGVEVPGRHVLSYDRHMVRTGLSIVLLSATLTLGACGGGSDAPPAEPPPDALKTASGLASKMLRVGLGSDHPTAQSRVTVNYTGWTPDGKTLDSSSMHGGPQTFRPSQGVP